MVGLANCVNNSGQQSNYSLNSTLNFHMGGRTGGRVLLTTYLVGETHRRRFLGRVCTLNKRPCSGEQNLCASHTGNEDTGRVKLRSSASQITVWCTEVIGVLYVCTLPLHRYQLSKFTAKQTLPRDQNRACGVSGRCACRFFVHDTACFKKIFPGD